MDEPDLGKDQIVNLEDLRWRDSTRYGTKAANLGELNEVARNGSSRWLGFYRIPRPPRENLLPYLHRLLGIDDLDEGAKALFRQNIRPRARRRADRRPVRRAPAPHPQREVPGRAVAGSSNRPGARVQWHN
jgi:hypothetical protein